jgi:hypothetical protein
MEEQTDSTLKNTKPPPDAWWGFCLYCVTFKTQIKTAITIAIPYNRYLKSTLGSFAMS